MDFTSKKEQEARGRVQSQQQSDYKIMYEAVRAENIELHRKIEKYQETANSLGAQMNTMKDDFTGHKEVVAGQLDKINETYNNMQKKFNATLNATRDMIKENLSQISTRQKSLISMTEKLSDKDNG